MKRLNCHLKKKETTRNLFIRLTLGTLSFHSLQINKRRDEKENANKQRGKEFELIQKLFRWMLVQCVCFSSIYSEHVTVTKEKKAVLFTAFEYVEMSLDVSKIHRHFFFYLNFIMNFE